MGDLWLYNTMTRTKEIFQPSDPPHAGMYVCGPTVYGDPHLGHARPAVTFDVLYRYLRHLGYKVRYVRNITDVGHLEEEFSNEGEDRILKRAKLEKLEPMEVVQYYTNRYHHFMDMLNVLPPSIEPHASGHIIEQQSMVKEILSKGFAYEVNGSVYFDLRKFDKEFGYGKLSGRVIDDMLSNTRELGGQDEKKFALDFALWKKADAEHLMQWDSPWGRGYPGWHIECSVMSMKYIGETLDIHGGGIDNIFPHHDCEIAQSEAATGKTFIKYFIHNNMLTVDGKKMGKSLGNFIILKELFKKLDPMVLRFYILLCHYGSPLDFTQSALDSAKQGYERLKNSVFSLNKAVDGKTKNGNEKYDDVEALKKEFLEAMDDDFNTSKAVAVLYDILKISNTELLNKDMNIDKLIEIKNIIDDFTDKILGLKMDSNSSQNDIEDKLIEFIIQLRNNYRKEKNYKAGDEIRDMLLSLGITIKDDQGKTTYTR